MRRPRVTGHQPTPKRGYSKAFRPRAGTGRAYLLNKIPVPLWVAVQKKAKCEGISIRALILTFLTDWAGA
jgi:hypothetical protein